MKNTKRFLGLATVCLATAFAGDAAAQSIIKSPGDHPEYHVELEPHGVLAWPHAFSDYGLGAGLRLSIPIVQNGFIKTINNNVAISFGADWVHYSGCYYYYYNGPRNGLNGGCGASYFMLPVAMQWNFWLTPHWSVFGEPGLYVYHGIFSDYCNSALPGCSYPTSTGIDVTMYGGARFHFNNTASLTMRVGYPVLTSVGVSFFL